MSFVFCLLRVVWLLSLNESFSSLLYDTLQQLLQCMSGLVRSVRVVQHGALYVAFEWPVVVI